MRIFLISVILSIGLLACTSPQTSYYTLSAAPVVQAAPGAKEMRVMVGPVSLPDAIDQPQLVVQSGNNEIQVYEYHRWAGSLKSDIGRVISANVARELGISNIWNFSQSTQTNFDYQIFIDVQNLESKLGDSVVVDVLWTIKPINSKNAGADKSAPSSASLKPKILMGRSLVREPVMGSSIEALVAAQSRAFSKVGIEISQAIPK